MQMRTPAVSFPALLMLLLLATRTHGIRLDRQLHEANNNKKTMAGPKAGEAEASIAADSAKKHCTPDGRCSGKVKKALAHAVEAAEAKQQSNSTGNNDHHTSAVDGEATQQQGGRRHEAAEVTSSSSSAASSSSSSSPAPPVRQRETYPDIMDIAGMDYSPATRKPPIHN